MNLYRVTVRGFKGATSNTQHGVAYVVAETAEEAYLIHKRHLVKNDYGFPEDRMLEKVELLAEEGSYPYCGAYLFIQASDQP